jgi:hypothetical protein
MEENAGRTREKSTPIARFIMGAFAKVWGEAPTGETSACDKQSQKLVGDSIGSHSIQNNSLYVVPDIIYDAISEFREFDKKIREVINTEVSDINEIKYSKDKDEPRLYAYQIILNRKTKKEDYIALGAVRKEMFCQYSSLINRTKLVLNNAWY